VKPPHFNHIFQQGPIWFKSGLPFIQKSSDDRQATTDDWCKLHSDYQFCCQKCRLS